MNKSSNLKNMKIMKKELKEVNNKKLDMDVDMDLNDIGVKGEDIVDKILLEEFKR